MTRIGLGLTFLAVAVCAPLVHGAETLIAKRLVRSNLAGENLLHPAGWRPYEKGYDRVEGAMLCDNTATPSMQRGATQTIALNQTQPEPIVAVAWSKAQDVSGSADADYSVYLDLIYADGTTLWGQVATFAVGTHDWQRRQVIVLPEKPVKQVSFYLLLRGHGGKAWFRDAELRTVKTPEGAALFDGLAVLPAGPAQAGFQVRDVAANSDFVRIDGELTRMEAPVWQGRALDLQLTHSSFSQKGGVTIFDAELVDLAKKDRAVTLVFTLPIQSAGGLWFDDPRRQRSIEAGREYTSATSFRVGSNGRLSRYPLAAVVETQPSTAATPGAGPASQKKPASGKLPRGIALAIDPSYPAFFRLGCSAETGELYLAYDIGLTPEKPSAHVRFCWFEFDAAGGFRAALAEYYRIFPEAFRCRTPSMGLWMPFAKISEVKGHQDFGFKFKEGDNETRWDDAHGMLTFRYTEPMTWWMAMGKDLPRTLEGALAEARRLAEKGSNEAKALFTSGYHDAEGRFVARILDTPWCNGAVWSMNSMPRIGGEVTDFKNKWNAKVRETYYGAKRPGDLDGEYIDSCEGYVTDELDFRREHFAVADTPLVFSPDDHRPAIFRGLVAFEYIRAIAGDMHRENRLMMANGAPTQLCWLPTLVDVMGTETDWNPGGKWQPMADTDMLYRRVLAKGKPYCFLMNTRFDDFPSALVEKYMKRSLAYGMFPGFFSADASSGHYFSRPELYDRDRPLFKRYVPLCKRLAEAGWEPLTQATSSDPGIHVERFGPRYLTVFNDSPQRRTAVITLTGSAKAGRELLSGRQIEWNQGRASITLEGEDVAVVELE